MKKTKLKGKAIASLLALSLTSCGNLNNARLAIGGDTIEIDAYSQGVAPSYVSMGQNRHFSLSASEASIKIKGTFEKRVGDVSTTYVVDLDVSSYSFNSAFIYASDYQGEESSESSEEIDTSQRGAMIASYNGYISYNDGTYSYLEQNGSHAIKASLIDGNVAVEEGNYDIYGKIFSLPLFPNPLSLSAFYSRLMFLNPTSTPLITQSLLTETTTKVVANAYTFKTIEEAMEFNDELMTVSSFGDNVFGIGLYMDRADYASFLSAYKAYYLKSSTEEEYMNRFGNFYDNLEMNRLAISQVNNSYGIVDFGVNIDCELASMGNYVLCNDGSYLKVNGLELDIEVVYNFSQGDGVISTYDRLLASDALPSSESSQS